jgi:predicted nucleic acid-binding protein
MGRGAIGRGDVSGIVLLDNEAVQALRDPGHPKHRRVLGHVQVAVERKARMMPVGIAAPTAVRVEAGWNRTASGWAFINRLRIADIPLDAKHANAAAAIASRTGVSVADAHLGAAIQAADPGHVTVLSSDPADMQAVAEGRHIQIVTL